MSDSFHPQTNGLTERTNEVVEAALRHYFSADTNDWDEMLPLVEFALNSSDHEAIKSTPFRMNCVCLPANPFDVLLHRADERSIELTGWMGLSPFDPGARTIIQAYEEFQQARRCVQSAKSRMKDRHDGEGVCAHLFEVGQLIWFNIKNIGLRHDSRRHNLLPKYWGPFKILELIVQNAVLLDMPAHLNHIHQVVSVSLIKPYKARVGQAPTPITVNSELEFEVEDIIDFNIVKSNRKTIPPVLEFRVRWKGCAHDSWHEPQDFANMVDTLCTYLQRLSKRDCVRVLRVCPADSLAWLPPHVREQAQSTSKSVSFAAAGCLGHGGIRPGPRHPRSKEGPSKSEDPQGKGLFRVGRGII
jgi:hypothetical protein